MSWSGLATNQAVSWRDLQDAIDTGALPSGGTAISVNDQCIYKSLATITNYVNCQTGGTYGSRATNDLLLKQDFTSNVTPTNTFTFIANTTYCIDVNSLIKISPTDTIIASELNVGDKVYTKKDPNSDYEYFTISDVKTSKKEAYAIYTENFKLNVSSTQPILKEGNWVNAEHLIIGDNIYTENGYEKVISILYIGVIDVLFYTIDEAGTFFANGIYCHNKTAYPLTGWSSASLSCSHSGGVTTTPIYYTGTFGNGTVLYSNTSGGGFPSGIPWGTGTSNYYYNSSTGYSFTVTYNSITQTYTVANYAACTTYTTWLENGGVSYGSNAAACAAGTGGPGLYSSISGMVTSVTTFYTNTALTTPFNGGGLIWSVSLGPTYASKYAATINSSGVVTSYTTC